MDMVAMMIATGLLCGIVLVVATAVLLLQNVPEGYPVGPHLAALQDYLPGYSVSWKGMVPGFLYGSVIGALIGAFLALVWNLAHYMALGIMLIRGSVLAD